MKSLPYRGAELVLVPSHRANMMGGFARNDLIRSCSGCALPFCGRLVLSGFGARCLAIVCQGNRGGFQDRQADRLAGKAREGAHAACVAVAMVDKQLAVASVCYWRG